MVIRVIKSFFVQFWVFLPPLLNLFCFSSVAQSCSTLCDPMNHSTPGLPVHHQLPESTQTHVHRVGDTVQPSHPLSSPSPPALNTAEIDVFLELSCFFNDPADVGNLISGSSAFSKTSLNIWKFMVHILLKSGLENFEDYFTSVWYECNCAVVWAFFGIAFLWDWNENWPFPVLWPLYSVYFIVYVLIL